MEHTIRWIGQGGFILDIGAHRLVIDPYLSDSVNKAEGLRRLVPPACAPEELKAELIISTHDHLDHLDEESLRYAAAGPTVFGGPQSCVEHFKRMGIKEKQIQALDRGAHLTWNNARIHAVFAAHTPDSIGVVVGFNGLTLYFTGDSEYDAKLAETAAGIKIDILVCCINGKMGNMDFPAAARLAREVKAKAAVPCHYGMFAENTEDPKKFKAALAGSGIEYRELAYNKPYTVEGLMPKRKIL